jgi:hypothetical protein
MNDIKKFFSELAENKNEFKCDTFETNFKLSKDEIWLIHEKDEYNFDRNSKFEDIAGNFLLKNFIKFDLDLGLEPTEMYQFFKAYKI